MNEAVKQAVLDYLKTKYPNNPRYLEEIKEDRDYVEVILDCDEVYSEIMGESRHYDDTFEVVKMGDYYVGYDGFHITGDLGMYDMGLEYDYSSFILCEKKTEMKEVVTYVPKK